MYLPLTLEVKNGSFTGCLDFMVVNSIKKHLLGLTDTLPVALISALILRIRAE